MKYKYQIQYRDNGRWANGDIKDTKEEAERQAKSSKRDYQIIRVKVK